MVDTTESKGFVIKLFNSILMVFFVKDINLYKLINTQLTNSPRGPRRDNSPLDCFLNGLSVGTTVGASFTNSIVIETLVIDCELNSETKRKSRSFDLLFFLAPQVGLARRATA